MNKLFMKFVWFLPIALFVVGLAVRLYKVENPVADWHSWRQSATAAVSRHFVQEGIDILHPKYTDISTGQTGYDNPQGYFFAEFPIYGVIHAVVYRIYPTLPLDQLGRVLSAIYSSVTTVFVYLLAKKLYGLSAGVSAGLFYALLPFGVYFGRVILPEPLAIMFGTGAIYLFIEYFLQDKPAWFWLSAVFLALAILVKPFAIFYGLPIAYLAYAKFGSRQIRLMIIYGVVALAPFLLWRVWISNFPEGIPHFKWAFNGDGIRFRPAWWRWLVGERIGLLMLGVWGVIPAYFGLKESLIARNFKGRKGTNLFMGVFGLAMFLYLAVFATANVRHDYYQTFLVPFVVMALGLGVAKMLKGDWFGRVSAVFAVLMMLGISFYQIRGFYNVNNFAIVKAGRAVDALTSKDVLVVAPYNKDMTFLYHTNRKGWPFVDGSMEQMIDKGASVYVSTNFNDMTTQEVLEKYRIIEENSDYVIADLTKLQ